MAATTTSSVRRVHALFSIILFILHFFQSKRLSQQEGPSVQILDLTIPKIATGVGGSEAPTDFPGNSFLVLWSERDCV